MEPNPRTDFNEPETYYEQEELRFQVPYWVNHQQVNEWQYEHGDDAVTKAVNIYETLHDLYMAGIIKSYGVRVDDNKYDRSTYLRQKEMELEPLEKVIEQFYADHPECHPGYPKNQ